MTTLERIITIDTERYHQYGSLILCYSLYFTFCKFAYTGSDKQYIRLNIYNLYRVL